MKVYLDTGVFIDYLIYRGHAGHFLRKKGRRKRSIQDLTNDALECFNKIKNSHEGFTSSLTLYEVEESMYQELCKSSTRIENRKLFIVSSSRSLIIQTMVIVNLYNLKILDLTEDIIIKSVQEIELQLKGIRAADSLHILTAINNNTEVNISTDGDIIKLDEVFKNKDGVKIKCMDTDVAKSYL